MAASLIVMARKDLGAGLSGRVLTCDASEWGFGVTQLETPVNDVQRLGMISERSRFSRAFERSLCPRQSALDALTR